MEDKTIARLDPARCTGCFACMNVCPTDAIVKIDDSEGFFCPDINMDKCIGCGKCMDACPVLTPQQLIESMLQEVYAAWSLDKEIRYQSTSGGVFSELAREWLMQKGMVCGAQYGTKHHIEHVIIETEEGLERIRQSKYAQSDIGLCYRRIRDLINQGIKILFCGTPCQCAGLMSFLGGQPDGLFIVNFVCRGANSPGAYNAFLKWLENRYEAEISRVWFKNKTHGWNRFSTRVEFENGQVYSEDRYHDVFIRGYIEQNLYMRECCHNCEFRNLRMTGDITLADFWGVKLEDKSKDIDRGTSLVIVNTEKGRELFDSIKPRLFWERKAIEDAFPGNVCITDSPRPHPNRRYFLTNLNKKAFDDLCAECFTEPSSAKKMLRILKRKIKGIVKH